MSDARDLLDKKVLKGLFPLNNLSAVHLKEVAKKARLFEVPAGLFLFRKGKFDSETYYLLSGELAVIGVRQVVGTIGYNSLEAKRPLVPGQPRPYSIRTAKKSTIMRVNTKLLNQLLDWDQSARHEAAGTYANSKKGWMTKILKSELLSYLPTENKNTFIMRMKEVRVKKGTTIINQHETGDLYFVIKKGQCIVSRKSSKNSKPILIAELRAGDSFGEEALLSDGHRNTTVTMTTNGSLMKISKREFAELRPLRAR